MSCKPFKTSEANAKAFLKTKGVIDNFLNVIDLGSFRNLHITLRQQAKTKYFSNVEGWNEKLFFENETGTKIYPNKEVFKKIDNINAIKTSIEKKEKAKLLKEEKERKIKEARLQQMRDAKRKGEPYSDEYLFEKTKKIGEPMEKKLRETYFKDSDKRKASDVLEEISKSNHPLNKLAKKLLPYIKENNVDIELSEDSYDFKLNDGTETTAAGIYSHSEKKIILFKNKQYNAIEKLILHESLHAVSNYQLKQNTKTNNDFKKLFEHAKENLPSSYELENIDEFLVGIFSDSRFINELKKLPPIEIKKYDNFLEEILDHLLSFLGFKKETTLYEQAFSIASNILEEQKNYLEQQRIANEEWEEYLNVMPNEPLFSPAEEVKPGVSELFESNPELANSVYEALGFKFDKIENSNNITLEEEPTKDGRIHFIITGDNGLKGNVYLYKNEEEKVVYIHDVGINIKNKGYGTTIYKLLGEKFSKEGFVLGSTSAQYVKGLGGRKVWDKLVKEGMAEIVELEETEDIRWKNEMRKLTGNNEFLKNVQFRYISTQITPQQKQQAQQQYSQYLDTIFPDSKVKDIVYHGTKGDKFDKFKSSETGTFGKGVYFGDYKTALQSTDVLDDFTLEPRKGFDKNKIIPALINTQNIFQRDLGGNGIRNEYVVKPEQIYILGSKKDIEGFKEFVEEKQTSLEPTEEVKMYKGGQSTSNEFFVTPSKEYAKQYGEVSEVSVELGNILDLSNDYNDSVSGSNVISLLENKGVKFTEQEKQNIKNNNLSNEPLFSIINRNPEIKNAVKRSGFNSIKQLETKTTDKYGRWDNDTLQESYFVLSQPKIKEDVVSLEIENQIDELIKLGIIKSKCN
jgi:hypothetical protein